MQYWYPGCISQQWRCYVNKPPISPEPAIHPNRDGAIYRVTGYYLFLIRNWAWRRSSTMLQFSFSFSHDHSHISLSTDIEAPIKRTEISDCSCTRHGSSYFSSRPLPIILVLKNYQIILWIYPQFITNNNLNFALNNAMHIWNVNHDMK